MKKLILLNENTDIKLNDTGTIIQFKAQNDGQPVSISNGQTATFRIKNDFGFVKSVKASSSYGGYVFELDTADLSGLVVGSYQVELLIQKDADDALIFPDTAFVGFNITANALTITGEQLPMMSLDGFKDELKTYVTNQTTEATSNIKNDFDTYVKSIPNNVLTTANNAITTANQVKTTLDSAYYGSRNLVQQSESGWGTNSTYYRTGQATKQNEKHLGSDVYAINSQWSGVEIRVNDLISRNVINTSDTFIYSVYVKKTQDIDLSTMMYMYSGEGLITDTKGADPRDIIKTNLATVPVGQWTQLRAEIKFSTLTPPDSNKAFFGLEFYSAPGSDVLFACPKLERGIKGTDYTPAPEDIETNINSLQSNQSTLLTQVATAQSTANTASQKATANASLITANNTLINNVAQGGAINYLKNSDFIFGSNNWNLGLWNLDTTNLFMGHPIVTISKTGLNSDAWNGFTSSQFIPVVPGQRVSFGGWAKISDGDQTGFRIELNGYKDTSSGRAWNVDTQNFTGTKDWQRLVYEGATIPDGVNYIRLCPTLQRNGNVSATLFSICLNDKIQPWVMSFNDYGTQTVLSEGSES